MTNIIGDIAGQYKALVKLVGKMPEGEVISVGDMVDRGPDSQRVLDYFRQDGRRAILGNHEHMMHDALTNGRFYASGIWAMNGGNATLLSFDPFQERTYEDVVPQDYIDWIAGLPKYIELDGCLLSHAFLRPNSILHEECELGDSIWEKDETTIIWNRREPRQRDEYRLQICGHNSQFGLRFWPDYEGNNYAICLDDSRKKVLTGYHLETGTIYQQEYI